MLKLSLSFLIFCSYILRRISCGVESICFPAAIVLWIIKCNILKEIYGSVSYLKKVCFPFVGGAYSLLVRKPQIGLKGKEG